MWDSRADAERFMRLAGTSIGDGLGRDALASTLRAGLHARTAGANYFFILSTGSPLGTLSGIA